MKKVIEPVRIIVTQSALELEKTRRFQKLARGEVTHTDRRTDQNFSFWMRPIFSWFVRSISSHRDSVFIVKILTQSAPELEKSRRFQKLACGEVTHTDRRTDQNFLFEQILSLNIFLTTNLSHSSPQIRIKPSKRTALKSIMLICSKMVFREDKPVQHCSLDNLGPF